LSTLRQLGVIMIILALGCKELSFFHLLSHALFKSLLFLCAGVFIHRIGDVQDIRYLGSVGIGCPVSSFYFIACSLSLCGFPFITGFYSKDFILEVYFIIGINIFLLLIVVLGTFFTVTYSVRLTFYLFFKNMGLKNFVSLSEQVGMLAPMRILFMLAVSAGRGIAWFYFPIKFIFLSSFFKFLVMVGVLLCVVFVYILIENLELGTLGVLNRSFYFIGSIWFLPNISTNSFIPSTKVGGDLLKYLDQDE